MFVKKASGGNLAEVKMGELAASKGESQAVKDFGQQMVTDHGKANTDLQAAVTKDGGEFAPALDKMSQTTYDHLSGLSGAAFDKAYVADMVKDHIKDESEYKMAVESLKNEDLKGYATTTLPVIQHHLEMIKQIKAGMTSGKKG